MANWYGSSRSNYFRVKDRPAFDAWLATVPDVKVGAGSADAPRAGKVCLIAEGEYGDWPSSRYDGETGEDTPFELEKELAQHLAPGEVAVLMQIGAERLRYLTGWACAVNHEGEVIQINLDEIYELAALQFGVKNIDLANY